MEPGETFEEAARREVREETGLLVGELKLVGSLFRTGSDSYLSQWGRLLLYGDCILYYPVYGRAAARDE